MATESTEPANCIQPVAPRIGAQAAAEAPPPRESCALLGSRRPTELCRRGVLVRRIQIHGGVCNGRSVVQWMVHVRRVGAQPNALSQRREHTLNSDSACHE